MPQTLQTGGFRVNRFPELVDIDPRDFSADPTPVLNALMTYPAFRLAMAQNQVARGQADEQAFELGTKKATRPTRRTTDINKSTAEAAASDYTLQDLPKKRAIEEQTLDTQVENLPLKRETELLDAEGALRKAEADRATAMQAEFLRPSDEEAKQMQDEDRARKIALENSAKALKDAQAAFNAAKAENDLLRAQATATTAEAAKTRADKPEKRVELSRQPIDIDGVKKMAVISRDPGSTEPVLEIVDLPEGAKFDRAPTAMEQAMALMGPPQAPAVTPLAAPPSPTPAPRATAPTGPVRISNDQEYNALPSGTEFIAPDGSVRRKP